MYQTDIQKQVLHLNGKVYTYEHILDELAEFSFSTNFEFHNLFLFLKDWFNSSDEMTVQTSGSTGTPKLIRVKKRQMIESALATCSFLGMKKGDRALLCLSTSFIAGKMMIVRALVAELELTVVQPSGFPLSDIEGSFDLVSMVPMQVYNSYSRMQDRDKLMHIKTLLVGGGPVSRSLEMMIKDFPNRVFSTYGMTETLSHIALRRINGEEASECYTPLPNVSISLNRASCLVIDAPLVSDEKLETNDVAVIFKDGNFVVIGRTDNIINTGGVKIQTERLESLLSDYISTPYAISSLPDEVFGEIVVLVVEGTIDENLLLQNMHADKVPSSEIPKKIYSVDALPKTHSGKINRKALKNLVENYIEQ